MQSTRSTISWFRQLRKEAGTGKGRTRREGRDRLPHQPLAPVLRESPNTKVYLQYRKIGHLEATGTFRLLMRTGACGLRLPGKRRRDSVEIRGHLKDAGHLPHLGALALRRTAGHPCRRRAREG